MKENSKLKNNSKFSIERKFSILNSQLTEVLGWEATRTLEQMCEDSWRWQSNNPNGYKEN